MIIFKYKYQCVCVNVVTVQSHRIYQNTTKSTLTVLWCFFPPLEDAKDWYKNIKENIKNALNMARLCKKIIIKIVLDNIENMIIYHNYSLTWETMHLLNSI